MNFEGHFPDMNKYFMFFIFLFHQKVDFLYFFRKVRQLESKRNRLFKKCFNWIFVSSSNFSFNELKIHIKKYTNMMLTKIDID